MAFKLRSQDEPSPAKQEDIVNPYKKKLDEYKLNDDGTYTGYFAQNINASRNTSQAKAQTKNIMKMIERGENAKAFAEGNKGGLFGSTKHIGKSRTTSSYSWSNNPSAKVNEKEVLNALKTHGGVDVTDNIVTPTNTRKVSKTINAEQYKLLGEKVAKFSTYNLAKENKKKELELKKQQLAEKNQAKLNSYLASKNKKTK
jgi:hypothetical protein